MQDLVDFAAECQRQYDARTTPEARKGRGHFGTPASIAEFMAASFTRFESRKIKLLDAGAGVGTLSAAVCDRIAKLRTPRVVHVEAWENDPDLHEHLSETLSRCGNHLSENGHTATFEIRGGDFILAQESSPLFGSQVSGSFTHAILNPPYFKLRKESPQARAMRHVVHGQPNIYALFIAAAADLLSNQGEMVAITPRSYFNGPYFRKFRRWFLERMSPKSIHIFESRNEAFRNDKVLQENIIMHAVRTTVQSEEITITTSTGRDLDTTSSLPVLRSLVIADADSDAVIRVPTNVSDLAILEAVDAADHNLRSLGMEISTGPVVSFRATEFLLNERTESSAPLLWMHNVRPFVTRVPWKNSKPCHICVRGDSEKLLLPSRRYVLIKRFTSKEEPRRLVAAVMQPSDSYSEKVGLENHLNYIHVPNGELSEDMAWGMAAILNSGLIDRFFRTVSGNTQVNAAEIRALPLPDKKVIEQVGAAARLERDNLSKIEARVDQAYGASKAVMKELSKDYEQAF